MARLNLLFRCDDTGIAVRLAEPVVRLVGGDWEVSRVPDIRVVEDGIEDPEKQYEA